MHVLYILCVAPVLMCFALTITFFKCHYFSVAYCPLASYFICKNIVNYDFNAIPSTTLKVLICSMLLLFTDSLQRRYILNITSVFVVFIVFPHCMFTTINESDIVMCGVWSLFGLSLRVCIDLIMKLRELPSRKSFDPNMCAHFSLLLFFLS